MNKSKSSSSKTRSTLLQMHADIAEVKPSNNGKTAKILMYLTSRSLKVEGEKVSSMTPSMTISDIVKMVDWCRRWDDDRCYIRMLMNSENVQKIAKVTSAKSVKQHGNNALKLNLSTEDLDPTGATATEAVDLADINQGDTVFITMVSNITIPIPEVHAMCYVLNEHSRITPESLQQLIDECVESNAAFTIFSPEFLEKYKQLCFETMEHLIDKPRKYVIHECLKFWNTWDNYALSISYFQIIQFISSSGFTSNAFLISFSKILLGNVHPDPFKRSNYTTTRYAYKSIFYQETSIRDFELLVDNFDFERFKHESVKESRRSQDLFSHLSMSMSR